MQRRDSWVAVLSVVEAIALFTLLFAVASSDSPGWALAIIAAIVMLCIAALRLIDLETFRWLPGHVAFWFVLALTAVGLAVGVTRF
jgi:hypothetical protein